MAGEYQPGFGRRLHRRVKSALLPAVLLTLTGIFTWASTQGDHGLIMRPQQMKDLEQAKARLAAARAERDMWERKAAGLLPSSLDRDALDELARSQLQQADPADIIVQYPENLRLFPKR